MNSPFLQRQEKAQIGNDAGWVLEFYQEDRESGVLTPHPELRFLRVEDYNAEIRANLLGCENNRLQSGEYSFVIEGLTDEHYRTLSFNYSDRPTVLKLYLYWRDTIGSLEGYLASFTGFDNLYRLGEADLQSALVAVLAIKRVMRRAGSRRYETAIQAEERVTHALSQPADEAPTENLREILRHIENRTQIRIHFHPPEEASRSTNNTNANTNAATENTTASQTETNPGTEQVHLESGKTYRETIDELAARMEQATGKYGRGMLLIRDGDLYFGVRDIPLESGAEPKKLNLGNGLIEVSLDGASDSDPYFDRSSREHPPRLTHFRLTLKGRADLKPGDLVAFNCSPEDQTRTTPNFGDALVGIAGPMVPVLDEESANEVRLYINAVEHRLGRTSGFVTIVTGVSLHRSNNVWDSQSPAGSRPRSRNSSSPTASSSTAAAQSVRQIADRAVSSRYFTEMGEIRGMQTNGRGNQRETPGQTITVWRGLVAPDGRPTQASRLPIQRTNPTRLDAVPYATSFAWGKCGLVLPRYPGTRVLMSHRNGQGDDPIDMGALWESGHGPDSQAGDWWLILPVDVPEAERSTIDDDATPEEHTGKVTQDLVDAEGNRIIEVGEFTIRIGKENLRDAGTRPERPDDEGSMTIEHTKGGSKIVMTSDGSIVISAKSIEFNADDTITMNAKDVNVHVSGSMNVQD